MTTDTIAAAGITLFPSDQPPLPDGTGDVLDARPLACPPGDGDGLRVRSHREAQGRSPRYRAAPARQCRSRRGPRVDSWSTVPADAAIAI